MIRVRFAPSPTGFLHIGGLRTCFYNWLYARQNKGQFVLRIEDTDQKRMVPQAIEGLTQTLKKMGLEWDEFYQQSNRLDIYQKYVKELVANGHAYHCFCSSERLEKVRERQIAEKKAPQYDRHCRFLSQKEIEEKVKAGESYVIRLKVPEKGMGHFFDSIRGKIEIDLANIDDQVLLKSDHWPTYHLANVIDDHLMGITHVIRGEEWLPSTIKHILLYQYLGWKEPKFVHLPLLLNSDKSKLSKRQGDVAVEDYLKQGYLPEALLNFIALLGWNPGNDREIFKVSDLIKHFSLKKVQKAGAVFNLEKLNWLNGLYVREMNSDQLLEKILPFLKKSKIIKKIDEKYFEVIPSGKKVNQNWLKKVIILEQGRMKRLKDVEKLGYCFWNDNLEYKRESLLWKNFSVNEIKNNLLKIKTILANIKEKDFQSETINQEVLEQIPVKERGAFFWPWRVALSGQESSPPPNEIAEILGPEETLKRVEKAINKL
ncbi:glutamate--tRNA ligase [Patescibacteria group bacterium]|nr:glutamate--tRNA ligase [Patescibacteria group bacterium]